MRAGKRDTPLPRSFLLLLASQGISLTGSGMQQIALPLWAFETTGSTLATGIAFAVQFVPIVVLVPWAGYIADRFERRALMIVCELGAAVSAGGVLLGVHLRSLPVALLFAAVIRALNAVTMPAMQAMTLNIVPMSSRARSASLTEAMFGMVNIFAPLAGTAFAARSGFAAVMVVDLVSFVVSGLLLFGLRRCPSQPGLRQAVRATVRAVRSHGSPLLRWIVAAEGAYFLLWGADAALGLLIAKQGFGSAEAGVYAAATGAGWLVASVLVTRRLSSRPIALVRWSAALIPPATVAFVALAPLGAVAVALPVGLLGAVNVAMVSGASTVFQREAPAEAAGRLYALRRAVLNSALSLSYLLLPGVSGAGLGNKPTLVVFAFLTCAAVLMLSRVAARKAAAPVVLQEETA